MRRKLAASSGARARAFSISLSLNFETYENDILRLKVEREEDCLIAISNKEYIVLFTMLPFRKIRSLNNLVSEAPITHSLKNNIGFIYGRIYCYGSNEKGKIRAVVSQSLSFLHRGRLRAAEKKVGKRRET